MSSIRQKISADPSNTQPQAQASRPLIGVAIFLLSPSRPNRFLLGKRLGSHGSGTWALPGGHLELSESFEMCAARELFEETGLRVELSEMGFLTATNDVMPNDKHYVTIFMVGRLSDEDERVGKEAALMEKEKCEKWEWTSWAELVEMARLEDDARLEMDSGMAERSGDVKRLFPPMRDLLEQRPGVVPSLALLR